MNIPLGIILFLVGYSHAGITPLSSDNQKTIDSNFEELALEVQRQSLKQGGIVTQNVRFSSSTQQLGNVVSNASFTANGLASFNGGMVGPQIIQAWAHFVGTGTVVIMDSVGVSSVTDLGTGDYRVTLSTPYASVSFGSSADSHSTGSEVCHPIANESQTHIRITCFDKDGTQADPNKVSFSSWGRR